MPDRFDVFRNALGPRHAYPLVVVLQSPFANLPTTRIIAPATPARSIGKIGGVMTPNFELEGQTYTLEMFQLSSIKVTALKHRVGNVSHIRDLITRALYHLFNDNA